jgi:uncharacterized protein YndB with AHSA1/START domain
MSDDREIVVFRTYAVPRDLVWRAWTDPQSITHWWGPIGFSTTTHHMDMRPGGTWRFTMHGPDGRDYENQIVYDEVVPHSRLTYHHAGVGRDESVHFHSTVTFDEVREGTRLTVRMVFPSTEARDQCERDYGAVEGGLQTVTRLGDHLDKHIDAPRHGMAFALPADRRIVLCRRFDAPAELVFDSLTRPECVPRWLIGPPGWSMPVCEIDLRPGGRMHYLWRGDKGEQMEMHGAFVEIDPPRRIVHTERFTSGCPEQAGEQHVTTTLSAIPGQPGGTTLTITIAYGDAHARDAMLAVGFEAGVAASYRRLAEVLDDQVLQLNTTASLTK